MKISVVLATYNGEKYIKKQLESILFQTRKPDEVIICDDRSTDKTPEICKNFIEQNSLFNWHYYTNGKNLGFCLNFFGAMEKASGDIIFLCDQDDIWVQDKCEKMAAVMEKNSDIYCLASRYDIIDENGDALPQSSVRYAEFSESAETEDISVESLIGCSYIRGFSICCSARLKEYLKPIDLKDLLAHDWLISIISAGLGRAVFYNKILTHYRSHGSNASLSAKRSRRRRIDGLCQSVEAHEYVNSLKLPNINCDLSNSIERQIKFEKRRIKAIQNRNVFLWLSLAFSIPLYNRYYKGKLSGIRVFLGDFAYIIKGNQ